MPSDRGSIGHRSLIIATRMMLCAGMSLLPAIALTAGHGGQVAGVTGDRAAMLAGAVIAGLATLIALSQGRRDRRSAIR